MSEIKGIKNLQLVGFKVSNEEFGISIMKVQEIIRIQEITKVPQMPDFIEGIINLRGNVIPIIDLRKRFGLPRADKNNDTRIVVVSVLSRVMGIIVDSVSEVIRLSEEQIEPPPPFISSNVAADFIKGVGKLGSKRLLLYLDIDKMLSSDEHSAIDEAA